MLQLQMMWGYLSWNYFRHAPHDLLLFCVASYVVRHELLQEQNWQLPGSAQLLRTPCTYPMIPVEVPPVDEPCALLCAESFGVVSQVTLEVARDVGP